MGTGIRVADINQIKQYAEDKEYEKALVLIRQQDLSKTFNSQFARICGEVLLYTKNYEESRYALINAHKMAPEGNRIDYDLIMLYLETGELALAEKYYEQYVFNAGEEDHDLCWLNYHMARSKHSSAQVLYDALAPIHTPDRSDELTFEFMKIYRLMGDQTRFDEEYQYWKDTFRDSIYKEQIERLTELTEIENIEKELYTYPDTSVLKHDAQIDALEETLLEQDYFRMYPKEPEIVLMADDYDAQDDQSYMLKVKMDKWSQKRREKAEKRAAAKAGRKQAKQDKKDAGKADEKAAKAEGTEMKPEDRAAETGTAETKLEEKPAETKIEDRTAEAKPEEKAAETKIEDKAAVAGTAETKPDEKAAETKIEDRAAVAGAAETKLADSEAEAVTQDSGDMTEVSEDEDASEDYDTAEASTEYGYEAEEVSSEYGDYGEAASEYESEGEPENNAEYDYEVSEDSLTYDYGEEGELSEYSDGTAGDADDASGYSDETVGYADDASEYGAETEGYADDASEYSDEAEGYADDASEYSDEAEEYADDASEYSDEAVGDVDGTSGYSDETAGDVDDTSEYSDETVGYADDASGYSDETVGYPEDTLEYSGESSDEFREYHYGPPKESFEYEITGEPETAEYEYDTADEPETTEYEYDTADEPENAEYEYDTEEEPEVYEESEEMPEYGYEISEEPVAYDAPEESSEYGYEAYTESGEMKKADKHQQAFDEYDALLKQEEERLAQQFEREERLLKEAENLLASVQTGVNDWNSQKVNNLFEAFDMDIKKKDTEPPVLEKPFSKTVSEVKTEEPDVKVLFENSFETVREQASLVQQEVKKGIPETDDNAEDSDRQLPEKKQPEKKKQPDNKTSKRTEMDFLPQTQLREHLKNKLTLDAYKREILQQLKERR